MEKYRLMIIDEVLAETRMGRTKLYQLISEGRFPKQADHGKGSSVWARGKVDFWIDCVIKGEPYSETK